MENKNSEVTIGSYLSDFVYGGIDGSVTTFAIVAGVIGASLSPTIVLILGFANLFADGFSMAVGNYLSTKSRKEYADKIRKSEEHSVINIPEEETEEITATEAKYNPLFKFYGRVDLRDVEKA